MRASIARRFDDVGLPAVTLMETAGARVADGPLPPCSQPSADMSAGGVAASGTTAATGFVGPRGVRAPK